MTPMLSHIRRRRSELRRAIDVRKSFEQWEETCVPSYVHPNPVAAYISWQRLFIAAKLGQRLAPNADRVLDFGSSVGELSHILDHDGVYEFVEIDDAPAEFLLRQNPRARRLTLEQAPRSAYDLIFAIDSLEHNEDYGPLLAKLAERLKPGGALVLSGPTENYLYRLGRKIAGFDGHYHHTTIFDIEREAEKSLERLACSTIPFGIPLFRVTAWRQREASNRT